MHYTLAVVLMTLATPGWGLTKYVKENGRSTGISWQLATGDLQAAIDEVADAGGGEVWVAMGSYFPTRNKNRAISFQLRPGVKLYGGFNGTESALKERNIRKYRTILDGNIGSLDKAEDNSYHVVVASSRAEINGFTIKNGNANLSDPSHEVKKGKIPDALLSIKMSSHSKGGGIYAAESYPKILNCNFESNQALIGGAIYTSGLKQATVKNGSQLRSTVIEGSSFFKNTAYLTGGAIANDRFSPTHIANNSFRSNLSHLSGGAITNLNGSSAFIGNNYFTKNRAQKGGAVAIYHDSSPVILDSSFVDNEAADKGSAIYQATHDNTISVIRSSSFVGNRSKNIKFPIYSWLRNTVTVSYSCLDVKTSQATNKYDEKCLFTGYKKQPHSYQKQTAWWMNQRQNRVKQRFVRRGRNKKIYVDSNNTTAEKLQDGQSWKTAYSNLETAIKKHNGKQISFLLRGGVYKPLSSKRDFSFKLSPGSKLIGGYSSGKSKFKRRTIISGDVGLVNNKDDNLYHVVTLTSDNVVKNLTIASGKADGALKAGGWSFSLEYKK